MFGAGAIEAAHSERETQQLHKRRSADDGEGFFVQSARSRPTPSDDSEAVTRRCELLDVVSVLPAKRKTWP